MRFNTFFLCNKITDFSLVYSKLICKLSLKRHKGLLSRLETISTSEVEKEVKSNNRGWCRGVQYTIIYGYLSIKLGIIG